MQSVNVEHLPSGHSSAVLPTENGTRHSEDEMRNLEQLLEVGTIILGQALDLLDNSLTSDEQLSIQSQYMPGSTIGTNNNQLGLLAFTLTLIILYKANIFVTLGTISLSC
jgi:hypothetical protein